MANNTKKSVRLLAGRRLGPALAAFVFAAVAAVAVYVTPALATAVHTFNFTADELDDNWEPDRQAPSDGVESISAFNRDNVARIGIDSDEASTDSFRWYEGIKTVGAQGFGQAVQVDLYIDPDWDGTAVNAGLWVAGADADSGERDSFAILEFVNNGTAITPDFRIWNGATATWSYLEYDFSYGEWTTLTITLEGASYLYAIDGEQVGTAPSGADTSHIREVFLNSANYGERPQEDYPGLNNDSYAAHWHGGLTHPQTKDECKEGGWADLGFSNQGRCIQFVNTGRDSR